MTLANLPIPIFTGADLSARLNAAMVEARAARRFPSLAALLSDTSLAYGNGSRAIAAGDRVETAEGYRYRVAALGSSLATRIATAGGVVLDVLPSESGELPADAFGLKGDGTSDDSPALAKALAAQNALLLTQAPALPGTSSTVTPWLTLAQKQYHLATPLTLPTRCFIRGNNATLSAPAGGRIFNGPTAGYRWIFEDLTVWGDGVEFLFAEMNNINNAEFVFRRVTFSSRVVAEGKFAIVLKSRSSRVILENCNARTCPNVFWTDCDFTHMDGGWYQGFATVTAPTAAPTGCRYRVDGGLTWVNNCVFVPEGDGAVRQPRARWFDRRNGRIYIRDSRFGGENGGLPLIYDFGPSVYDTSREQNNAEITIENCNVSCGSASRPDAAVVVLQDGVIPGRIKLERFYGLADGKLVSAYGHDEGGDAASQNAALRADLLAATGPTRMNIDIAADALGDRVPDALRGYVRENGERRRITLTAPAAGTPWQVADILKPGTNASGQRSFDMFHLRVVVNAGLAAGSAAVIQEKVFRVTVGSNSTNVLTLDIQTVPNSFSEWSPQGPASHKGDVLVTLAASGVTNLGATLNLSLAPGVFDSIRSVQVEMFGQIRASTATGSNPAIPVLVGP